MKRKKVICFFLVLLNLTLLAGCNDNRNENVDKGGTGRYIESEMDLPKLNEQTSIVSQTLLKDGSVVIYTVDKSSTKAFSIARYKYNSSKTTYEEEAPQWLQNIHMSGSVSNIQIVQGTNDTEYLFWTDDNGGSLYKTQDGKTMEALKLEGWDDLNSNGIYPVSIQKLDNDMIVVNTTDGCCIYDEPTGKEVKQIAENYLTEVLSADGNKFVLCKGDSGLETMTSLSVYDAGNLNAAPEVITFDTTIPLNTAVFLNNKGLILANQKGIHLLINGTNTWQTVVDGSLNTMYLPNIYCNSVLQDRKDNYYVLYHDLLANDFSLMKYQFDETVNAIPSQELTIYTLKDSPMLCAAAIAFQKEHNDFKVTIEVAMSENSTLTKEDYIRSLNTELLSGNGCDLILLDGLPVDSYIEKGALSDLSSIVDPLMKSNSLLANVVTSYYKDDKIYAIPSRIKLPMLFGKADAVQASNTLDKLAEYANQGKGAPLLGAFTYEDIMAKFLPCYMHKITTEDKQINADNLKKFLEDIKIILDRTGYTSEYTWENNRKFYNDLPVSTTLYNETTTDLFTAGLTLSFVNFIDGDFSTFENSYEPVDVIGINKSSKHQDLSQEFIQYMLSDKIQNIQEERIGFPIRTKTLETMKPPKWWEGDYDITYEDGTIGYVPLTDISDSDRQKLIGYCKAVTQRIDIDDNVFHAITEGGENYILGDETIDKTVEEIENKLSLYSEE